MTASAAGRSSPSSTDRAGLAFTRVQGDRSSVWTARADGSHARRVTNGARGTLSADGRWLAYEWLAGNRRAKGTYVVRVAGGRPKRLGHVSYVWSTRGARLAFAGNSALKLYDAHSGERRTLVRARNIAIGSFAPDGRAVVYTRSTVHGPDADLRSDIYTVRLSDGHVRRLTHDHRSGEPVWGADWIAYRRYSRTKWPQIGSLWFMRPDGSRKHLFARGDQALSRAHYGLAARRFSSNGRRLLACISAEFGCTPVSIFVASRKQHVFSLREFPPARGDLHLLYPDDMSADGLRILIDVGPLEGDFDRVYAVPFAGGKPRLVAAHATFSNWAG